MVSNHTRKENTKVFISSAFYYKKKVSWTLEFETNKWINTTIQCNCTRIPINRIHAVAFPPVLSIGTFKWLESVSLLINGSLSLSTLYSMYNNASNSCNPVSTLKKVCFYEDTIWVLDMYSTYQLTTHTALLRLLFIFCSLGIVTVPSLRALVIAGTVDEVCNS